MVIDMVKKIFGIGLSKTGTTSLTTALEILGYSCIHNPLISEQINQYDAATDIVISSQFEYLDKKYPDSKFILTTRDLNDWLNSCQVHFDLKRLANHSLNKKPEKLKKILEYRQNFYGSLDYNLHIFTQKYYTHHNRVFRYFADKPDDLLVMNICNGDGWIKLCPFLCKSIPSQPFPWENARAKT